MYLCVYLWVCVCLGVYVFLSFYLYLYICIFVYLCIRVVPIFPEAPPIHTNKHTLPTPTTRHEYDVTMS